MQEKHMRTFVEVARLGSFSKAAETLYLSVPALKKQMDALEDDLQVTLLVRKNNGVSLTKAGQEYLAFSKKMLAYIEAERLKLKQIAAADNNIIRFGFNVDGLSEPNYIYALGIFKKRHPTVSISFVCAPLTAPDAYDLFIGLPQISPYKTYPLRRLPAFCILAKDHPLASRKSLCIQDLRVSLIRTVPENVISSMAPALYESLRTLDAEISYAQQPISQLICHAYAQDEQAISLIFGEYAELPDIFVAIPLEGYALSYELHIPHPIEKPIVAEYVDFITEYYRTHAP